MKEFDLGKDGQFKKEDKPLLTSIEAYCQLLGLSPGKERPRPSELPEKFLLPDKLLGDLRCSACETLKDGLERSQSIFFLHGEIELTRVNIGTPDKVRCTTTLNKKTQRSLCTIPILTNSPSIL